MKEVNVKEHVTHIQTLFGATAELYAITWGDFFHLALGELDQNNSFKTPNDIPLAFEKTHTKYLQAISGSQPLNRIIEIACGRGAFAEWLASSTKADITGIDISDVQLDQARKRLKSNLHFIEKDAMEVSQLQQEGIPPFDAAICMDAAVYFPNKKKCITEVKKILKPGGRFLLIDWCQAKNVSVLQKELIIEPFYKYWGIHEMETIENYQTYFQKAGFQLLECEDLSAQVHWNWVRGYELANQAISGSNFSNIFSLIQKSTKYGIHGPQMAKNQYYAVLFAKVAADLGLLRYAYFLVEVPY